MLVSKAFEMK